MSEAIHDISAKYDIEIGVQIFRQKHAGENAPVFLGNATTQFRNYVVNPREGATPPRSGNWDFSGYIHSHGRGGNSTSNNFSEGDIWAARTIGQGGNAWLAAPDKHLYKWDFYAAQAHGFSGNLFDYARKY